MCPSYFFAFSLTWLLRLFSRVHCTILRRLTAQCISLFGSVLSSQHELAHCHAVQSRNSARCDARLMDIVV